MQITNASAAAIRYACQNYHYSGSVPSVQYGYNIYNDDGEWCGVVCFGGGANNHLGGPYGLIPGEALELVRVALNGKQLTTSQCVAAALRKLREQDPIAELIISYADCDQGHVGTIYQATNWVYEGIKKAGDAGRFWVNGVSTHSRTITSRGWRASEKWLQEHIDPNARGERTAGKHKYLFAMTKKERRRIAKLHTPYPRKEAR